MRNTIRSSRLFILVSLGAFVASASALAPIGCQPEPDVALPSEDDLYAYSQAVARRNQLIVAEDGATRALFNRGHVEQLFGYEDNAIALYDEVTELDPNMAEAYVQKGFILSQRNERHPEAIEAFQQALRAAPGMEGVYTRLGLIYLHQDNLEEAEKVLREEIRVGTPSELTFYNLGQTLALQDRHEEALELFQKALALNPTDRMPHYGLSQSYRALGKPEESKASLEEFRRIKKLEDEARQDPSLGGSNRDQQFRSTSKIWLDGAVLFLETINRVEDAQRRRELDREYLHAVQESIRFNPHAPEPREALVSYFRAHREPTRAAKACLEALESTRSPELIRTAYEIAGSILKGLNDADERAESAVDLGQALLESIVKAAPELPGAQRELARVYLFLRSSRRDLLPRALEHAQKAVELSPDAMSYDILALALFRSGDVPAAQRALEEGLARNPDDPQLRTRLEKLRGG